MPKKVCLVDGSGYIFRAFYALPPMTNPAGLPVNAVYGFTNMFLKLTSQIKCDYSLVLFDAKRKNFRNEIFPDYKGTRKEIPEDLIPQFELIHNAVSALNLNYLEMDGFEADDLIATYAAEALKKGYEVVIVSGDKDLMQLIRPGIEFYDPMKDKFSRLKTSRKSSASIRNKSQTFRLFPATASTMCRAFPESVRRPQPNWSISSVRWREFWNMPAKSNKTNAAKRCWPIWTTQGFPSSWFSSKTTCRSNMTWKSMAAAIRN